MLRNIAVYVALLVCGGAAAYYFNDRLGYTPLLFLVFLAVFDAILAFAALLSIKIEGHSHGQELIRGDKADITFMFANRGPLIISRAKMRLRISGENIEHPYKKTRCFMILTHSNVSVDFFVTPPHVGVFKAQIIKIRVYGLFGLFGFSYKPKNPQSIWVLPKISGNAEGGSVNKGDLTEAQSLSRMERAVQNPDFYSGVREYEPGDPIHNIHWKLTAHAGKYMTRFYESDGAVNLTIAVDLRPAPCGRAQNLCVNDKIIETAVSAASECVSNGGCVRCVFSDGNNLQSLQAETPADISGISARLVTASAPQNSIFANDELRGDGAAIVYFTANADMKIAMRLAEIKSSGGQSALVYVVTQEFDTEKSRTFLNFLDRHHVDYTIAESEEVPQSIKRCRRDLKKRRD